MDMGSVRVPGGEKRFDELRASRGGRHREGSAAKAVGGIDAATGYAQQGERHVGMPTGHGQQQRRRPARVALVDDAAGPRRVQKHPDGLSVATLTCEEQSSLTVLVLGRTVRTRLEQQLHDRAVPLLACSLQWRAAAAVGGMRRSVRREK